MGCGKQCNAAVGLGGGGDGDGGGGLGGGGDGDGGEGARGGAARATVAAETAMAAAAMATEVAGRGGPPSSAEDRPERDRGPAGGAPIKYARLMTQTPSHVIVYIYILHINTTNR